MWVCGRKRGDARGHVLEEQLSGIMNICERAAQEANSAMGGGNPQDVEAIMTIWSPLSWCADGLSMDALPNGERRQLCISLGSYVTVDGLDG